MKKKGMKKEEISGVFFIAVSLVLLVFVIIFTGLVIGHETAPKAQAKAAVQVKPSYILPEINVYNYQPQALKQTEEKDEALTQSDIEKMGMDGYFNGVYRFEIYHPYYWDMDSDLFNSVVTFGTDPHYNKYQSFVMVDAEPLNKFTGPESVDDVTEQMLDLFGLAYGKIQVFDSYDTKLGGEKAHAIVFGAMLPQGNYVKLKVVYAIKGDYLYSVSYMTNGMNYQDDLKEADKILDTFEFI